LTLSGASLVNLAPGTDVSGDLVSLVFNVPGLPPASDTAGFPLGSDPGDLTYTPQTVQIGTDAAGEITSWNISDLIFASYPAFGGENPTDFFCNYALGSSNTTDSSSLTNDHDAGFCPANSFSAAADPLGFGASGAAVPEPASYLLLGGGLAGLLLLGARRGRIA
jgi:hypothetical protein